VAVTVYVIADLEFPRLGLIRVDDATGPWSTSQEHALNRSSRAPTAGASVRRIWMFARLMGLRSISPDALHRLVQGTGRVSVFT